MIEKILACALNVCVIVAFVLAADDEARRQSLPLRFGGVATAAALAFGSIGGALLANAGAAWEKAGITVGLAAAIVCAVTDAQTGYVFDRVTRPALIAIVACAAIGGTLPAAIAGGASGGGILLALFAASGGRGIGLGDVKLAACIGASLGAFGAAVALGAAFVLGGAYGLYQLATGRASRGDAIRFAPYLTSGMVLALLLGAVA
ncbi:MAG TPA: A24 family peptidase [Candidatus Baltobacteraceae bacterium]|jgi:prepilin signal peptidase PulO-like enzyme (type II secretory pathway)